MKLKQTSFKKMLFTFIALVSFTFIGAVNVEAKTVTVTTEAELRSALEEKYTEESTIKLGGDITVSNFVAVNLNDKPLTFDLAGNTLEITNGNFFVYFGSDRSKSYDTGSFTFTDSSSGSQGQLIVYKNIIVSSGNNNSAETPKTYNFTIDGGNYSHKVATTNYLIELFYDSYGRNITADIKIKKGTFTSYSNLLWVPGADDDITMNFTFDTLTYYTSAANKLGANRFYSIKFDDVVPEDSKIYYLKKETTVDVEETELTNRNINIAELPLAATNNTYIKIIKDEGFNVDNVTLDDLTFGYSSVGTKNISIYNRGTSDLKVKTVASSSTDFIVEGTNKPIISAGATDNASFTIKAKEGLPAGTYTADIIVTDANDKTYTATVTLKVNPKSLTLGVNLPSSWVYGTTQTPTLSGIEELGTGDYVLNYYKKDGTSLGTTQPKLVGEYKAELSVNNANYSVSTASVNFEITPITDKVTVRSSDDTFEYDGTEHSNNTYSSYYLDSVSPRVDNTLPNGDKISAVITGKVKDVKDTADNNNTIESITITNSDGNDVTNCYSNIVKNTGKLTVTKKDSKIKVTTEGAIRVYNGEALTNSNYTASGTEVVGDNVVVTMTGSQTYVGNSDNTFTVKVMRGTEDVTDNYTFDTHSYGTLTVTPAEQNISIADQYVRVNGSIATSDLIREVSGAKGNVNISIYSGTALTYNNDTYSFDAGIDTGDVVMTVTATSFDENSDGEPEWKETTKYFTIHVVEKESVSFNGIEDNQVFTYDGINSKTPVGSIAVIGNKVPVNELEVFYKGTGTTSYSSINAPTNAGNYTVTYKVKDSNPNYMGSVTYNFTIKKIQLENVTIVRDTFEYTGSDITPTLNNVNSNIEVTGATTAKNVSNNVIIAKIKDKTNFEWKDNSNSDITLNWSITQATPDYTVPTDLTAVKGETLNDVTLPDRFTWNDAGTVLTAGTHNYKATYTPVDTVNYKTITNIDIQVVVKDLFNLTTSVDGSNGTITASKTNIVEGSTVEVTFTPDTGYMIDKVFVNSDLTTVTGNKLNLTMNESKEVKVSYKKIPFTVTVKDVTGATITPNGAVTVNYGDNQDFTIIANTGYKLVKVLVDGTDKISDMLDDTLTLSNITSDINLEVVVEKIVYEVIEGANQKYVITENDKAVFKIDASFRLFKEVYVDDVLVDSDNYDLESGSTIITLKKEYVDTLSVGEHTLRAVYIDGGEATTKFTVAKVNTPVEDNTNTEDNPKTGDNIIFYVATGILSMIGLAGAGIYTYRRKQEN